MGVFTALGIALSKYHPERVMEHLRLFWGRINIPRMIRGCEDAHLWPELVFLYTVSDNFPALRFSWPDFLGAPSRFPLML